MASSVDTHKYRVYFPTNHQHSLAGQADMISTICISLLHAVSCMLDAHAQERLSKTLTQSNGKSQQLSLFVVGGATLLVEVKGHQPEAAGGLPKALCLVLESLCQNAL